MAAREVYVGKFGFHAGSQWEKLDEEYDFEFIGFGFTGDPNTEMYLYITLFGLGVSISYSII